MADEILDVPIEPVKSKLPKIRVKRSSVLLLVGGLIIGFLLGTVLFSPYITGAAVSAGTVESKLDAYLSEELTKNGITYEILNVEDKGSVYEFTLEIEMMGAKQEVPVLVTKDGKYLISSYVTLALEEEMIDGDAIPKTDRPTVDLFVMSYCPYGLQMEKAYLPVQELLGDYADFNVKFVHYLMHGEKEASENTRQYCIQRDTPDLFLEYLNCFVDKGDADVCMVSVGADKNTVNVCITDTKAEFSIDEDLASGDAYPRFGIDAEESKTFGVSGSPAVVINGKLVTVSRTPEAIKKAVCSAFTEAPSACEVELSSDSFSSGFGLETTSGSGGSGGCGA